MRIRHTIRQHTLDAKPHELPQRIEDLEDLRELNQAVERNGKKPLIPWSEAKEKLGLA